MVARGRGRCLFIDKPASSRNPRRATIKAHPSTLHRSRPYRHQPKPNPVFLSTSVGARADDVGLGGPSWSPVGGAGPLLCHRQASVARRTTAGDHKGPPVHPSPPSPLRTLMGFYGRLLSIIAFPFFISSYLCSCII